jgi:hypothetical protein
MGGRMRTNSRPARGYALLLVLMVLALISVGISTLLASQQGSAQTTGSMIERRRVFYACDGIGRAATVLAQSYMSTSAPSTQGLIDFICTAGGGGCCATTTDTSTNPTAGTCEAVPGANKTRLEQDPAGSGPSALGLITPDGFKIAELDFKSQASACTSNAQCPSGTCEGGFCRTVAPLASGPFSGMTSRQDTLSFSITAEHRATTQFRCSTSQTLTLGKIAMFQFFLFSDNAYTDWDPNLVMRPSGRVHTNGNLGVGGSLRIARLTSSGNVGCIDTPPGVNTTCNETDVLIAKTANPTMTNDLDFAAFSRTASSWQTAAITTYAGNAQDAAHGVPRLQLPIVELPSVQRGYDAANAVTANVNQATVNGVQRSFPNSRVLVDPVLALDSPQIRRQKFAHQADIRIINGAWFLKNPLDANDWPGVAIWSDHSRHIQRANEEFVAVASRNIGQQGLNGLSSTAPASWGTNRPPQRFSYYGVQLGGTLLSRDLGSASSPLQRAPPMQTSVISYGTLFRDASAGEHAAVWRPGVRTLVNGTAEAWCEANPGVGFQKAAVLDALSVGSGVPGAACTTPPPSMTAPTEAAALLAATRSGFRDGFAERLACGTDDAVVGNPSGCGGTPDADRDRRRGNLLPMNFDVHAFQEALADTTPGELGSYFCRPTETTCTAFMGRPFNGIVYLAAPYPGSEGGYGADGGTGAPAQLPIPGRRHTDTGALEPGQLFGVNHANHIDATGLAASPASRADTAAADDLPAPVWSTTAAVPLLIDHGDDDDGDDGINDIGQYEELRDDEVAALPYPLCSDGALDEALTSGGYVFKRPNCEDPSTYTRINAIRVINARRINSNASPTVLPPIADAGSLPAFATAPALSTAAVGQLPLGLSIVSNLPVYVVGDVNLTSDAYAAPTSTLPWVPVLVGGDVVHVLSNAWDDQNARWAVSNGLQTRRASVTRYHMAMLGGWGMSVGTSTNQRSGGVHNFPRALEDWSSGSAGDCRGVADFSDGCPTLIHGSMVIGFARVYTSWPFVEADDDIGRRAPRRNWDYDQHLDHVDRQPPGAPLFDVTAVREWTRR